MFYAISRMPDLWAAGAALGGSPKPAIDSNRIFTANFTNVKVMKDRTATFGDFVYYANYQKNTCCVGGASNCTAGPGFRVDGAGDEEQARQARCRHRRRHQPPPDQVHQASPTFMDRPT